MKKITLLFIMGCLGICSLCAQDRRDLLIENFESNTLGALNGYSPDNLSKQVVVNPFKSGENTSEYVMKITLKAPVLGWEQIGSTADFVPDIAIGTDLATTYRYVHFKVYKSFASQMMWIFRTYTGGSWNQFNSPEVWNSTTDQWEYVTLDLLGANTSITPGDYRRLQFVIGKTYTAPFTAYLDDVYLSNTPLKIPNGTTDVGNTIASKSFTVSRQDNNTVKIFVSPELKGNLKMDVYSVQGQLLQSINSVQASNTYDVDLPANNLYVLKVSGNQGVYSIKF